jgi:uncharacterized protein YndB with AHSA1/START domain
VSETRFHYVIFVRTTPEELWRALTDPAVLRRYFENTGPDSDWQVGSPVRWAMAPGAEFRDAGQVVLESEPGRRLAYTWHNYEPEIAEMFGWSPEKLAELRREKISKVLFELEPTGDYVVALKLTHDDFAPGSEMLKGVRDGWPMILSNLKTLLETGETLPFTAEEPDTD